MIVLRAMAPIVTNLASVAGAADRLSGDYSALWARVDSRISRAAPVPGVANLRFEHAAHGVRGTTESRYASIETDSLTRSPHIITLNLDERLFEWRDASGGGEAELCAAAGDASWPSLPEQVRRVDEATVRIYAHQVSIFEASLVLHDPPGAPADSDAVARWLSRLQRETITFMERVASAVRARAVDPVLAVVREEDPKHRFFHAPDEHIRSADQCVLWVSRSLLVPEERRGLLAHWTKDAVDVRSERLRDDLLRGDRDSLVRWLNYGFVDAAGEGPDAFRTGAHSAEFAGLRFAQETYASLDQVDSRLQSVLADASAAESKWQLEHLRGDLVWLSQRAELIVMGRQELLKYMTRSARSHFEQILDAWEYDALVEQPVMFKIELCNRRLGDLAAKRAARSNLVTDLILLGIGITSIAGTALAITEFGRNTASDPLSTGYDLGGSSFTSWFASQPIDVVLLASAAASSVLVVLYLYFRRDDGAS